ncbi:MAG: hypothetical protein OXC30_05060 [Alphaproteobacteria bacterium]|nr:hypothetical protein [Alphaproteobacteria bacterium]
MKNIIMICAMLVLQAHSAIRLPNDTPEQLKRLAKWHVELTTLQSVLAFCVQKVLPFKGDMRQDAEDFQTFVNTSKKAGDRVFSPLRSAFKIVLQSWREAYVQAQSDMRKCELMGCSSVEDAWEKLRQSFISFEILASNQKKEIHRLFLLTINSSDLFEQELRELYGQSYPKGKSFTERVFTAIFGYQEYIKDRQLKMIGYAKKFGVDVFEGH